MEGRFSLQLTVFIFCFPLVVNSSLRLFYLFFSRAVFFLPLPNLITLSFLQVMDRLYIEHFHLRQIEGHWCDRASTLEAIANIKTVPRFIIGG